VEPRLAGGNAEREQKEQESLEYFREATRRLFLAAGGFKRGSAIEAVKEGKADAVVFGESLALWANLPALHIYQSHVVQQYCHTVRNGMPTCMPMLSERCCSRRGA
jgi:2,4-dienoyl-CoA reductase-like NADH-dependent reductase (Old Yellow Enzyme family)